MKRANALWRQLTSTQKARYVKDAKRLANTPILQRSEEEQLEWYKKVLKSTLDLFTHVWDNGGKCK